MTKCKTILIAFMIVILLQPLLSVVLNPLCAKKNIYICNDYSNSLQISLQISFNLNFKLLANLQ